MADASITGPAPEPVPAAPPEPLPGHREPEIASPDTAPGLPQALIVGGLVVVVVLLAGVLTYLLPGDARDLVLRTPLLILVLVAGTAAVLWRISRPGRIDR